MTCEPREEPQGRPGRPGTGKKASGDPPPNRFNMPWRTFSDVSRGDVQNPPSTFEALRLDDPNVVIVHTNACFIANDGALLHTDTKSIRETHPSTGESLQQFPPRQKCRVIDASVLVDNLPLAINERFAQAEHVGEVQ